MIYGNYRYLSQSNTLASVNSHPLRLRLWAYVVNKLRHAKLFTDGKFRTRKVLFISVGKFSHVVLYRLGSKFWQTATCEISPVWFNIGQEIWCPACYNCSKSLLVMKHTSQVKHSSHCNISYTNSYGFNWFEECQYSCLQADKLLTLECVFGATPDYATMQSQGSISSRALWKTVLL